MGLAKGDRSIESIVQKWRPENEKNWVKIILKNRILANRYKKYDEYRTLYDMGADNIFLMAEAFSYINQSSYLPKGEDSFYKALITWGAKRNGISNKFEKKLESSAYYLTRFNCIEAEAVEIMYGNNHSKHMLSLLVMAYISQDDMSLRALEIYHKGLEEKLTIKDLFEHYVRASYHNRELLDLAYFRFASDIEVYDENCIRFIWVNFNIYREAYPILTNYYFRKYPEQPKVRAEDIILPEDEKLASRYVHILIDEADPSVFIGLYESGNLRFLDEALCLEVLQLLAISDEQIAAKYASELYKRSIYDQLVIELIGKYYMGGFSELISLVEHMFKADVKVPSLIKQFVLQSVLTRQNVSIVEVLLNNDFLDLDEEKFKEIIIRFLSAQVIIEAYEIEMDTYEWFIRELAEEERLYLEIAVLKSAQRIEFEDEMNHKLCQKLIKKHIQAGIMFPWYSNMIDVREISPNMRAQQYFEYYTSYSRQVNFCYRVPDETHYEKIPMKHIVFGLFLAKVVLFYGEHIQYYIEEYDHANLDIRHSDILIKDEVEEIKDDNNLFDTMNTIEISRILNDDESLEAAIENYMRVSNHHIGKIYIL